MRKNATIYLRKSVLPRTHAPIFEFAESHTYTLRIPTQVLLLAFGNKESFLLGSRVLEQSFPWQLIRGDGVQPSFGLPFQCWPSEKDPLRGLFRRNKKFEKKRIDNLSHRCRNNRFNLIRLYRITDG